MEENQKGTEPSYMVEVYFENGSGTWKWRVRYGERIVVTSYGLGYEDRDECLAEIAKLKQTLGDFLDKNS